MVLGIRIGYRFLSGKISGLLDNCYIGAREEAEFMVYQYEISNMSDTEFIRSAKTADPNVGVAARLKISLFPRRCRITDKLIWMQLAYRVRRTHIDFQTDFPEVHHIDRWYSKPGFVMLTLQI